MQIIRRPRRFRSQPIHDVAHDLPYRPNIPTSKIVSVDIGQGDNCKLQDATQSRFSVYPGCIWQGGSLILRTDFFAMVGDGR